MSDELMITEIDVVHVQCLKVTVAGAPKLEENSLKTRLKIPIYTRGPIFFLQYLFKDNLPQKMQWKYLKAG